MNKDAQRIAIAEACGWTMHRNNRSKCGNDIPKGEADLWENDFVPPEFRGDTNYHRALPDYLNDLNAMHEAEKLFYAQDTVLEKAEQMRSYSSRLCNGMVKYPLHSTASQRAEAFLKTLGLWVEEPNL